MRLGRGRAAAVLAVLLAATCWGTTGIGVSLALRDTQVDPVTLSLLRAVTAAGVTWLALGLAAPDMLRIPRSEIPRLAGFGLWSVTLFYTSIAFGIAGTSAAVGNTLLYLAPALVTIGGALWLGERLTAVKVAAVALSFAGILLVMRLFDPGNLAGTPSGFAWIIVAAVVYAGYSLFGKSLLGRHPAPTVLAWYLLTGAVGLLVVKLLTAPADWPPATDMLAVALGLGLVTTLIPTTLYLWALTRLPSSEASILATFEPVVAVGLAAAVLGERLDGVQLAGAAMVVAGVMLLNLPGLARARPKTKPAALEAGAAGVEPGRIAEG